MAVYYKTQVTLEFLSTVPLVNNPDSMHSMIASGQAIHRVISAAPAAIDLATLDAALAGYDAERSGPFRAQVDLVEAAGT